MGKIAPFLWLDREAEAAMLGMPKFDIAVLQAAHDGASAAD